MLRIIKKIYSKLCWFCTKWIFWFTALLHLPRTFTLMILDKLKGKKIIVYHLSSPGHVQYHLPTYKEIKKRDLPIVIYIAQDFPMQENLLEFELPHYRLYPACLSSLLIFIDIFIEGEVHGRGPKSAIKIFTGHGYPTKRSKWSPNDLKSFDRYFFYGPLECSLFDEIKKQHPQAAQHIIGSEIGYPKLDPLINNYYDKEKILTELGLVSTFPTILYAPAWDPGGALRMHGLLIPEYILTIENINLIVKLHPANLEPIHSPNFQFYTGGIDWRSEFEKLNHHPRFKFVDTYIINPLLAASDIMVTDFSGVALEFMTQHRPVIFFECPEFYEKTLPQEGCDPYLAKHDDRFNGGRNAGIVVETFEELTRSIHDLLLKPEPNNNKQLEIINKFLYNPGSGTQHEAKQIIELLNLSHPLSL